MNAVKLVVGTSLLIAAIPGPIGAVELRADTLRAWEAYIQNADSRMLARLDGQRPFLWADETPGRVARLRQGEVLVVPVTGRGTQNVASGLIHDWIGSIFIPNATIDELLAVVHDYNHYKQFYSPVVADSKVLACSETDQMFSMVWQHRILFIDAAIEGQYKAHDYAVGARGGYNIADTTEVREILAYGQRGEQLLPPDQGNGFIWRLHSIARYEERDGGVYLELEAIALTRDIPPSLRWLATPVVNHLSINSLATTLRQTRDAVQSLPSRPRPLDSCAIGGRDTAFAKAGSAY